MEPEIAARPDASALCTACGLCCAGLFDQIALQPGDLPLAERAGTPILLRDGKSHARLPCAFLADTVCTVYAERYAGCRSFTCKLLRRHLAGKVSAAVAHDRIAEMRRLLTTARADAGAGTEHAWRDLPDPAARAQAARVQLRRVTVDLYANKHFRNVPDPAALS